jgi:hypothetical protein
VKSRLIEGIVVRGRVIARMVVLRRRPGNADLLRRSRSGPEVASRSLCAAQIFTDAQGEFHPTRSLEFPFASATDTSGLSAESSRAAESTHADALDRDRCLNSRAPSVQNTLLAEFAVGAAAGHRKSRGPDRALGVTV